MKTTIISVLSVFFVSVFFCAPVFADINVNAATALVAVETSDGERASFDPGEDFGTIPEDALIEILEGSADVSLGEGSKCTVKVGGYFFFLDGSDCVSFSYDSLASTCSVTATVGSIDVRQGQIGTLKNMQQGLNIVFRDVSES